MLALESRFDLAYGAAHGLCLAAFAGMAIAPIAGTSSSKFCHIPWAWSLPSGVSSPTATTCRNLGEYEGDLNVDERLVSDLVAACSVVAARIRCVASNQE